MSEKEREQVQDVLGSVYFGHADKCIAFVWKALQSMKPVSVLATLVPAPFLASDAGRLLRSVIQSDPSLQIRLLGQFHGFGYFRAAVEPAFIVISKGTGISRQNLTTIVISERGFEERAIREVRKFESCRTGSEAQSTGEPRAWQISQTDLRDRPAENWTPRWGQSEKLLQVASEIGMPCVGDLFDVALGIRTGANDVFVLSEEELSALHAKDSELRFFRPIAGNATIHNGVLRPDRYVFYPYDLEGKPIFKDDQDVAKHVPQFFAQRLAPKMEELKNRKSLLGRMWWELVRQRSTSQSGFEPKLVSASYGDRGSFAYDEQGICCVIQGFAWLWRGQRFARTPLPWAYLAILNSPVFEAVLGHFCDRRTRGGQYDLSKKYVDVVLIPNLESGSQQIVGRLSEIGKSIAAGESINDDLLDATVAEAYGISLEILRGDKSENIETQFAELTARWKDETRFSSKMKTISEHPAYRKIVAMGDKAVPLILADLEKNGGAWFMALREITGVSPVPKENRGKVKDMASAWIAWGRERGYRWKRAV
jgi:adenine-specific DNA-methyltransferase